MQGLRGGVQAMEPTARRWLPLHRNVFRQYGAFGRVDVAACELYRASGAADRHGQRVLMVDGVRRLPALRARRMPGELSHGRYHANRIRFRLCAAGYLQRLRILRLGMSVWSN